MRRAIWVISVFLLSACDPGVFNDLSDGASTRALSAPDGFGNGTFGLRLASVEAPFGAGIEATRFAAVGGAGSGFAVYGLWTGATLDLGLKADGCNDLGDLCPPDFGADVAGVHSWDGQGACFAFTAPADAETRVVCENSNGGTIIRDAALVDEELGRSIAGVPVADHPVGVALLGAPGANAKAGALYRLEDGGFTHTPVPLPASLTLGAGDRFGDAIATAVVPADSTVTALADAVLVAVTASGTDTVYVLAVGDDGGGVASELLACIGGSEGFGAALAFGDLTGEGDPELVIGEAADAAGRSETVSIFPLASLTGEAGCGVAPAPAEEIVACPADLEVDCAGSGFGGALAIGDVDADAVGDLLIGAPNATVGGEPKAGAAFLLSGSLSGLAGVGEARDVLVDSDPEANARLGAAVTMVGSHIGVSAVERSEPVVSAPGAGSLFVFLCSELETIASLSDSRCLELD